MKVFIWHVFIKNGAAVTWTTQRQQIVALSTTEAEFIAACSAVKEAMWLKGLLNKIHQYQLLVNLIVAQYV